MFDLTDRVVVVTGGNAGIGLGMSRALVAAGAAVAVWGRRTDRNREAVDELVALGGVAAPFEVDVADEAQVEAATAATLERFDRIDTMVANAGIGGAAPITEQSLEGWRRVLSVNLDGAFLCFRAAARHMVERGGGGALVGVSSTSAIHGAPANQAYSVSKTGVLALVRGLAVELARHGIRANSLVPGWTETDLTAPLLGWEKFVDATTARTPVRRWGTPDDFGAAAVFLSDPTLTFHTGDCIVVDGGYTVF